MLYSEKMQRLRHLRNRISESVTLFKHIFWAKTSISQTNSHYNLHQGTVGITTRWNIDMSEFRPVGITTCRNIDLSEYRPVGITTCRNNDLSEYRPVGI